MRLATVQVASGARCAAVIREDRGEVLPLDGYEDVGALLRAGPETVRRAANSAGPGSLALTDVELLRPVLEPSAIICVGLNYRTHVTEMGREMPQHPALFSKLSRAVADPYADIVLPLGEYKVDYEGELAVVIGLAGRDIRREEAWTHVAGLTVLNDVTMRDLQRRSPQWFAGKTWEAATPMGPWLVTPDEFDGTLGEATLVVRVNGEERQRAVFSDLIFDIPHLIADISRIVRLQPGDVLATGTPGGVGDTAGTFLEDGDTVEVAVSQIGTIQNTFVTKP